MQKTIIHTKPADYPFERLLQDIQNNEVGTALYVGALTNAQLDSLIVVLKTGNHGLKQVTFRIYHSDKIFDLMHSKAFSSVASYDRKLYTAHKKHVFSDSIHLKREKCTVNERKSTFAECTPLFNAVRANNIEEVTRLLSLNASPNTPAGNWKDDGNGTHSLEVYRTPLEEAVINQNVGMVKLLLLHGANPKMGKSCLIELASNNAVMLQVLARAGCLMNYNLNSASTQIKAHLAGVHFPFIIQKSSDKPQYTRDFPHLASNPAELAQMLTTYDQAERALLARMCQFAYMRYNLRTASKVVQERLFYNSLMVQCFSNELKLKTLAVMRLDINDLYYSTPDLEYHDEVTVYGKGFHFTELPNDLRDEVIQMRHAV